MAKVFDFLEIEWRYEQEGFVLQPFGVRYLPDFHLPELGAWVEVKPTYPDERERRKTYLFNRCLVTSDDSVKSWERAFILYGDIPWPHPKSSNVIGWEDDDTCVENLLTGVSSMRASHDRAHRNHVLPRLPRGDQVPSGGCPQHH